MLQDSSGRNLQRRSSGQFQPAKDSQGKRLDSNHAGWLWCCHARETVGAEHGPQRNGLLEIHCSFGWFMCFRMIVSKSSVLSIQRWYRTPSWHSLAWSDKHEGDTFSPATRAIMNEIVAIFTRYGVQSNLFQDLQQGRKFNSSGAPSRPGGFHKIDGGIRSSPRSGYERAGVRSTKLLVVLYGTYHPYSS